MPHFSAKNPSFFFHVLNFDREIGIYTSAQLKSKKFSLESNLFQSTIHSVFHLLSLPYDAWYVAFSKAT